MQQTAHRLSRGVLIAALVATAPMALAGTQTDIKTNPLPVDRVLGRASGEAYFETQPQTTAPSEVTKAYDRVMEFLTQPARPFPPERFGRGGGNLPTGG